MTEKSLLKYYSDYAKTGSSEPLISVEQQARYHDLPIKKVKDIMANLLYLELIQPINPYNQKKFVISPDSDLSFPETLEQLEKLKKLHLSEAPIATKRTGTNLGQPTTQRDPNQPKGHLFEREFITVDGTNPLPFPKYIKNRGRIG